MRVDCFQDFDAFVESVRDVDSFMLLRNVQRRLWSNKYLNVHGVHVQLGQLGSGNIAEGRSFSNGFMIYLPLTDRTAYSANGCLLDTNSFAVLEPGCEFSIATEDEHDWCTVFVPTECFNQSDLPTNIEGKCRVTPAMPARSRQFRTLVTDYISAVSKFPEIETSVASSFAYTEFLKLVSSIVGDRSQSESGHEGRPRIPRDEVIRRSKQVIEHHTTKPLLVPTLAKLVGVSQRTLRTVFYEYYGIGPTRYMQLKQLQAVQRSLKLANAEDTRVSDVLAQYGVWEFGRFASRYHRHFGELPAETLRRKRMRP